MSTSLLRVSYPAMALFIAVALASAFTPSFSSPRHDNSPISSLTSVGFQVSLRRVESGENVTKSEFLQRMAMRSRKRMERLHAAIVIRANSNAARPNATIESPVHAGDGEYLMDLSIGTPPLAFPAILDTGSDLIWTQCKPCVSCFKQPTPLFDPKNSSSFSYLPCPSDLCTALPVSFCDDGHCIYDYAYGSGETEGIMGIETFTFEEVSVPNVAFGCGHYQSGLFLGSGLVGLGRGPLSLVLQLQEPKFSYCLTSPGSTKPSTLFLGSQAISTIDNSSTTLSTPLIQSPAMPSFYYLSLKGISVGGTLLPINSSDLAIHQDGSGGMIIDSGTTFTFLKASAFNLLAKEFTDQIKLPVTNGSLELCFNLPTTSTRQFFPRVPKLVFQFEDADLDLPPVNYFIDDSRGVGCLAIVSSGDGLSVFGNILQQNFLILYDIAKERLLFEPKKCDQ